ncbi:putative conjugative transfer protein TrbB [Legionella busanensis]|uniref:Putative conjugative transfer protein TrbB n=1 Tax=Legionella busanensis TaxID=190655 RepID=A0A378K975_9GAMM|nr:conjugal transfer protein TraF [Legionella busanensis]STX81266.1 putative conjugative transfer protein TrbB [Legionella busanensis]
MKKFILLLMMVFCSASFANPALDSINLILKKKSQSNTYSAEIKDLQKHYQFIFIHRADCPHCHKFAPILDDFANHYKIPVQAYSVDGGNLAPFKSEPLTPELFRTFFLSSGFKPIVPALFLLNNDTFEAYPVLFGEAQAYQLSERMYELLEHIKEQFHG